MFFRRFSIALGLWAAMAAARAEAEESNLWPAEVEQVDASGVASWSALGPLLFSRPGTAGERVSGFRPIYLQRKTSDGVIAEYAVLYPLFVYRSYDEMYHWSFFELINRDARKPGAPVNPVTEEQTFDIWPFYFSRNTGDPATSYHGVFPIGGTIMNHLWNDQIKWVLFPLYVQTTKGGATTTFTVWPIIRSTRGTSQGFGVWPLFGHLTRPGAFDRQFYLWPLIWNNTVQPASDKPAGTPPTRQVGFLPFYTSQEGPESVSKAYLWPFFGYTDRPIPDHFHETRYFWPFLVQGHGDQRMVDRWGPFYTHSDIKGMDKTWILWPLWRQARWIDGKVAQTKSQFAYFLYWKLEQRSTTNPAAAPAAKTHFWPFISLWDNGAGRRQLQVLSPFEVFFPDNDEVRASWTPLFALYRRDESPSGTRSSLLWDAITWDHRPAEARSEFHLGPLLSVEKQFQARRVAVGNGLFGWKRGDDGRGWSFFWMEFPHKKDTVASTAR